MPDQESFSASLRLAGCSVFSDEAGLLSAPVAPEALVLLTEDEGSLLLALPDTLSGLLETDDVPLPEEAEELLPEDAALSALLPEAEEALLSALLEETESASVLPEDGSALLDALPEETLSVLLDASELAALLALEAVLSALLAEEDALPEDAEDEPVLAEVLDDALEEELEAALPEPDELLLAESDSLSTLEELLAEVMPLTVTSSVLLVTVQSL